jgi:hypothetical protein
MKRWLVLVALSVVGCGGDSPVTPSPPPNESPAPAAPTPPVTTLRAEGLIEFTAIAPEYEVWDFAGHGVNVGTACATKISGNLTSKNALGQTVAIRAFALPATTIVSPGARVDFKGCCFSKAELDQVSIHEVRFTWDAVACLPLVAF